MRLFALLAALSCAVSADLVEHPAHGVRLERGFQITQFADDQLANDIWCMTLNPRGEVVVSGAGYVSTLLDTDEDGKADKAVKFATTKGAMGLAFDPTGKQVLIMGDGWLSEYRDEDLDRVADGPPRKILPFASGEHGGHAIKRGPDGWWWVIGGNDAKFGAQHGEVEWQSRGQHHPPKIRAGALLRISPDLTKTEVMADGFRNPYDFAFNERGDVFTYDSDCERDYFLPWYSGCRVYHVKIGGYHGWHLPGHLRSFRVPDYLPQTVSAVADLGRGSPTGVHCYLGAHFPEHYRSSVFVCDWTFGRIHHLPLVREGETYLTRPEVFLEPVGTHGFAPTSIVETADGALLVSIGGRKTRGSVYRITFQGPAGERPVVLPIPREPANDVLRELAHLQQKLGWWKITGASAEAFVAYEPAQPDGLTAEEKKTAIEKAQAALISLDERVRDEAARLLAMLEDTSPLTADALLRAITADSSPTSDFHFLACLARLRAEPEPERTAATAHAILDLDRKLAGGDRRTKQLWPVRLNEVVAHLISRDPALADALLAGFSRIGHLPFVELLPPSEKTVAANRFLELAKTRTDFVWTPELVTLLGALPEARGLLREQWRNLGLRTALRKVLQQNPTPDDLELLAAEKGLPTVPPESLAEFTAGLKDIGWKQGDASRGEKIYRERACATCHSGTSPLGPELSGPVSRLSPEDLMTDIQFPNRNISDAFRSLHFHLKDGSERLGLLVFTSADGVMIQTGPGVTERIPDSEIIARDLSPISLMPPALLTGLKPAELADLYAYMRTLRAN